MQSVVGFIGSIYRCHCRQCLLCLPMYICGLDQNSARYLKLSLHVSQQAVIAVLSDGTTKHNSKRKYCEAVMEACQRKRFIQDAIPCVLSEILDIRGGTRQAALDQHKLLECCIAIVHCIAIV